MKPTALMQLKAVSVCSFSPAEAKLNLNESNSSQPPVRAAGRPSEIPLTLVSFFGEFFLFEAWNFSCVRVVLSAALGGRRASLPQDVQTLHWHGTGCTGWKSWHRFPLRVSTFCMLLFFSFHYITFTLRPVDLVLLGLCLRDFSIKHRFYLWLSMNDFQRYSLLP